MSVSLSGGTVLVPGRHAIQLAPPELSEAHPASLPERGYSWWLIDSAIVYRVEERAHLRQRPLATRAEWPDGWWR